MMKTIVSVVDPPDRGHRASLLICVIFVAVFPILTATSIDDKNEYGRTYARKIEDGAELSKNAKRSKLFTHGNENDGDSTVKDREKIGDENGSALNRFLENVLKAQDDLKWLDQVVRDKDQRRNWENKHSESRDEAVSSEVNKKSREKRSFDRNYETTWRTNKKKYGDENELPQRVYLDNDRQFKRDLEFDDFDASQNTKETRERKLGGSMNEKGTADDQVPKDWSSTKDICSLNDWLNSNKNSESEQNKRGNRWTHDYGANQGNQFNPSDLGKETNAKKDNRVNSRSQRDKVKKEDAPSLETLKETILELKKSLNEGDKKVHENSKNLDSSKIEEKESSKEGWKERKARARKKHKEDEHEDEDSGWWDTSGTDIFDLKKREQSGGDLNDQNALTKVWRTKRTGVNNDDGNPKLFHRAGFGEPYLEEKILKELHDRKRRSKGTPSDEKRHLNEATEKNNSQPDEKNSMKISKDTNCIDADTTSKKEFSTNDLRRIDVPEQASKLANHLEDTSNVPDARNVYEKNVEAAGNYEQSDLSRGNPNAMGNKLTKNEERGESLEGNSLRTFGSMTNELQPVSTKTSTPSTQAGEGVGDGRARKTEENREDVGSSKRDEQVIKVFEPQGHLQQNDERTKEVRGIEADEEGGKSFQQGKRSAKESGNISILLKSENKNLLKLSNTGENENTFKGEQQPYVLNRFDMKKKLVLENEEKPGKSISTVFNVKIEKAQVDTPMKPNKREELQRGEQIPFGNGVDIFDLGKNKFNGELYARGFTNDMKPRNVDEERKNSIEIGQNEGSKLRNEEERFSDDKKKEESVEDSSSFEDKSKDREEQDRRKNSEIVIVSDGMDDRKIFDRYGQRRILQYMEYSNDDVEDVDSSYSDKEEEENQRQAGAEKSSASARRKERSAFRDKGKAKVNVLIKQKLDKKKKKNRDAIRKRRNPVNVIEYYDYDNDLEQQDHEALSSTDERERIKNNYDKNPIDAGLAENPEASQTCIPPAKKKDKQGEELQKKEQIKAKLKNKQPKQEFIVNFGDREQKNETDRTEEASTTTPALSTATKSVEKEESSRNQPAGRMDDGEDNVNGVNRGRLNQPIEDKEDKFLDGESDTMIKDPATYILNKDKNLDLETIGDFLDDIQSMDAKNEKASNSIEPLYEELKKIYDWNEDESKSKPRIKGDHRMYYGANDKFDPTNKMAESFRDQVEPPEIRGAAETSASSPNLLPLLLVHNGSGKSMAGDRTDTAESSDQPELTGVSNVSQSNYFALKSTDDMFKGGSEQRNSTEEKLRGATGAIGTAVEWQAQKVNGMRNGPPAEKDAGSWSLTNQRQYIDTDSRSPYENRKYPQSRFPQRHAQNIDREKQTVISSGDLHESFVEPLDLFDDFDKDIRVRLSRSLKTIETTSSNLHVASNATNGEDRERGLSTSIVEKNPIHVSTESVKIQEDGTRTSSTSEDSTLDLVEQPSKDLEKLFGKDRNRAKRQVVFPYDELYDDADYDRYSKNEEPTDDRNMDEYDTMEDDRDNYEKIARSASPKKGKKHKKKKKQHSGAVKKRKRKGHADKSKYTGNSRRKRRHHKKHSSDSKTKSHERDQKKHKKRTSKNANRRVNVKKSKVDQKEEKVHGNRRETPMDEKGIHLEEIEGEHTMISDSDNQRRRISSLLAIDNVEDESQMDSALHGELAGKIVKQIFDQVQKNEDLKVSLGPGLYQKHKARDTVAADKMYRQALNDDEIKHTEELLNKIMLLLNRLIFDEVQRKTCVSLSPDLIEFLDWMLEVNPKESSLEQLPSLPLIHEGDIPEHFPKDKFLFQSYPSQEMEAEIAELRKKLRLVEKLIKEYRALSERERSKVQSVHDYLAKQLDLLLDYIETKEDAEKKGESSIGAAKGKSGMILQYQVGMSNASNASHSKRPDTLINVPNQLKLSNTSLLADEDYLHEDGIDFSHKGRRTIRSLGKHPKRRKKHGKRKKGKRKHHKRHKGASSIDQPRHKGGVHKAAASRRKREYLDKEFWDAFDTEYEEPLIYSSMDFANVDTAGHNDVLFNGKKNRDECTKSALAGEVTINDKSENDGLPKFDNATKKREVSRASINTQSQKSSSSKDEHHADGATLEEEEAITGKSRLEDEIILLNKRQSWKKKNEEQLEEVAFGKDMRKGSKEKELFEKLTEIDKKKDRSENARVERRDANVGNDASENQSNKKDTLNYKLADCSTGDRNGSYNLSNEDKLRMLEEKINVYSDNE